MKTSKALFNLSALLILAIALFPHSNAQQTTTNATARNESPPAFSGISLCAPINLLIAPNTTGGFSFVAEGEQSAINNIQASFNSTNGLLFISAFGPISTNQTVKLTVTLPPDALKTINHDGPGAAIYVAPGFNPPTLDITTGFGSGQLYINNITATIVTISMSGIGSVIISGTLNTVNASSSSVSGLYLSGLQSVAKLDLSSTANAFIESAQTAAITGSVSGLNTVQYTGGSCSLTNTVSAISALSFPNCVQVAYITTPVPTPTWTCGLVVQGNFTCQPGVVLSSSTGGSVLSQGTGGPTLTSTIPGGFVSQSTSSGSSSGGGGTTQFQAGVAQPGSAAAQSAISGTGSVSSSATAASSSSGGSVSSTQTSQNGISQGFVTSSGGQTTVSTTSPGVVINYGENNIARATASTCTAPLGDIRMPISI